MNLRILSVCLASLSFSIGAYAAAPPPTQTTNSIIGTYNCTGYDPTIRSSYSSITAIKPNLDNKNTFYIEATYPKEPYPGEKGIGYIYNHVFVVMFTTPSYGIGTAVYKIGVKGNLNDGKFLYYRHPDKGLGSESCVKVSNSISGFVSLLTK